MQFADNTGPGQPAQLCRWSGPLLPAYRINGYCIICQGIGNVQIRLHRCTRASGPLLFAYGIRALFPCCAYYAHQASQPYKPQYGIKALTVYTSNDGPAYFLYNL